MMTYWHDQGDDERALIPVTAGSTACDGFPASEELAHRYADITGRPINELPFYRALGAMKLAAILEGVHARHLSGAAVGDGYEHVGPAVPILVARGPRILRTGQI
jgi:aminoglycoside phosphotransferase (APT) family kinase protein